jgi:hypothetical protein
LFKCCLNTKEIDDANHDNKILFHSQTLERKEESLGRKHEYMKQFPNSLRKFLMPYLVVSATMAIPIFLDSMLSWVPFIIAQGQEASLQERSADG